MKIVLIALITAFVAAPAIAQDRGWTTVGYKTVGSGVDRDRIKVRGNDRSRQIRLCSINRPIEMRDFDVYYANGGQQDVQVRQRINAGSCTRAIDLNGRRRNITEVRLAYGRIQRGWRTPLIRVQVR